MKKLAIQFGAGAIGRGLMAKLLHDSNYRVLLVDVFEPIVKQINDDGYFKLQLMDHNNEEEIIDDVFALCSTKKEDLEKIYENISKADIITTSVRVENLESTAKIIAKGLEIKDENSPKVDILAFENAFRASDILKDHIVNHSKLTEDQILNLSTYPNTVTDRIVQNKIVNEKSIIEISDDFEAVIEQNKLKDSLSRPIKGAEYTNDIDQYLERKLFLVNGAHAATAYFGYQKGYKMMNEAFQDEEILSDIKILMDESSKVLNKKYNLPLDKLKKFCESKLNRFLRTADKDQVERVARSPIRKLSANDRLTSPALSAYNEGLECDMLLKAIAFAFKYDNNEDEEALKIQNYIQEYGIEKAIEKFTGIQKKEIKNQIIKFYK